MTLLLALALLATACVAWHSTVRAGCQRRRAEALADECIRLAVLAVQAQEQAHAAARTNAALWELLGPTGGVRRG